MSEPLIGKAIPVRFYKPGTLQIRDNLSEEEQVELAENFAPRAMTAEEIAEEEQRGAEQDAAALASRPQRLNDYLDSKRYDAEQGGIVVAGIPVMTRDRDKTLITGKITEALVLGLPDTDTFNFTLNGQEITMTVGNIKTIGVAIAQHVQRCIDAASAVRPAIIDGSLTDEEQVAAAFEAAMTALQG